MPELPLPPRLAYVGEVPIRRISAGPALLYRLLESYPTDRLLVAESDHNKRDPATELPGVPHLDFYLFRERLMQTRFASAYGSWTYHRAAGRAGSLLPALRQHGTEAILTVAQGYGWITAAAAAERLNVPLHIICHDHWESFLTLPESLRAKSRERFAAVYRSARSRLSVSPEMEASYRALYGPAGTILYPSRGRDALRLERPPFRAPIPGRFVFAYAGSAGVGQRASLIEFANAVAPIGARLRIYQGITMETLRAEGLKTDNVDLVAFRPAAELHRDLIESVDAMYLPMSFSAEDRANVELCFPSKLTDYTVAGLPILVCSPDYGTATHWARSRPDIAEVVTVLDHGAIVAAANRLIRDEARRHQLAWAALRVGQAMFSQEAAYEVLCRALAEPPQPAAA